jgi:hypothetical protein
MKRFQVTVLLPNGETMNYVRYGESVKDVTDMEVRRNPSARSITVEHKED